MLRHVRGGKGASVHRLSINWQTDYWFCVHLSWQQLDKIRGVVTVLSIPFTDRGGEEKRKADGFNN